MTALGLLVAATLALLAALLTAAVRRVALGYAHPRRASLAAREAALVEAAGDVLFPAGGAIPVSGRETDLPGYLDATLGVLPRAQRLQIRALLFAMEHATLLWPAPGRGGRARFSRLSAEQRERYLARFAESRHFPLRLLFQALRALLTMGYLGHPRVLRDLGLAPREIASPALAADALYPPVGRPRSEIRRATPRGDAPRAAAPLDAATPLHPAYRASGEAP